MPIFFKHISFRWINLVALLALVLHSCLGYLPPEDWYVLQWLDLLTPLLVAFLWLLVLIRFPKQWLGIVLNGLVLIGLLLCFSSDLRYTPAQDEAADLRVITFNAAGFGNSSSQLEAAAAELNDLQPDVVVFQEFGLVAWWQHEDTLSGVMSTALDLPYYTWFRHPYNIFGLAIFSRYPIEGSESLFLPVNVGNGAALNRIQHPKATIDLIHLHLHSFNYGHRLDTVGEFWQKFTAFPTFTSETYAQQREQLVKILRAGLSSPNPVLLAGDFNNVPGSYYYRQLDLDFTDAFAEAGSGFGYTHMEWILPLRIDQQWASSHWNIQMARREQVSGSDHQALVVDYQLK